MSGCDPQTYFPVHCYHSGNIPIALNTNSANLGKEEKQKKAKMKKWLTRPLIPMKMKKDDEGTMNLS